MASAARPALGVVFVLHGGAEHRHDGVADELVQRPFVLEDGLDHCGAERFLMISTDKAVHPASVMGATKRVAEMVVQSRAASDRGISGQEPSCACVRFGNVVGSRGSVVPTFLRQIAEGGPITITDENMTRYFMTIPEAVQLVLRASTLGRNGNVYMLDMGDPLKITDLARKLIEMSGLRPDKDIEIRIVGARPGEKLYEELWTEGARIRPTRFQRIFAVEAEPVSSDFEDALCQLERAALMHDKSRVLQLLQVSLGNGVQLREAQLG